MLIAYLSQPSLATADLTFLKITPSKTESLNLDLTANGMLLVRYDLDGNTQADLYTIRIVKRSFFSKTLLENEYKNWADILIFFCQVSILFTLLHRGNKPIILCHRP